MAISNTVAAKHQPTHRFDIGGPSDAMANLAQQSRCTPFAKILDDVSPRIAPRTDFDRQVTFTSAGTIERRAFGTSSMVAEVVRQSDKMQLETYIHSPCHTLIAYERASRTQGKTVVDGLPPSLAHDLTNKLTFIPAGAQYRDENTPSTTLSAVYFHFSPNILPNHEEPRAHQLLPILFFENASLWSLMQKLKETLENSAFPDPSYFEALGTLLAHEIVYSRLICSAGRTLARGGLAPWQQRIVTNYIEQHLNETIPLATLASLVRLSPYYFCRAFKQSLGMPPHRYHTKRRIEVAQRMLLERKQPISAIGLDLGFSETSSFCVAFRKFTGTTPSNYRRSAA